MRSLVGVTRVQRLGFGSVAQKIDVLGAPKLMRFSRAVWLELCWDEMGIDILTAVSEFTSCDLNILPLWNEGTRKSDLIMGICFHAGKGKT